MNENAAWNKFDFVIVMASLVEIAIIEATKDPITGESTTNLGPISLLRVLRLLRIVRLLRKNPTIVQIVEALIKSVTAAANLLIFMLIILGMFAILGMQLYGGKCLGSGILDAGGDVMCPYNKTMPGGEVQLSWASPQRSNFDTFPTAFLTLFKMMSGGGTWGIMYNALKTDLGPSAPIFFLSYQARRHLSSDSAAASRRG